MSENLETQATENEVIDQPAEQQVEQAQEPVLTDTRDIVAREVEKMERARDEAGRFAKQEAAKAEQKPAEQPKPAIQQEQQPTQQERNRWASWKKEAQEKLNTLDPAIQSMIEERESQFHRGIQGYKEDATYGRSLRAVIAPHMEYMQQLGVQPEAAIANLMQTERAMRTGSPEQKAQIFQKLALDYGVDLQALQQVPFNSEMYNLQQQYASLQAQMQSMSQSRQMAEEAQANEQLNNTIQEFRQSKPFFDDLLQDMAAIYDRGLSVSLEEAYNLALMNNPEVAGKWQAQQQAASERQKLEAANNAAKQAKQAAVSVKGSPSGHHAPIQAKTTEEAVRYAMAQHGLI